jgi:hypothetical protein
MRRLVFTAILAALPASAAFADAPTLNVQATCRATPAVNLDQQATYDNCMRSENAARDKLNKTWAKMRVDWRSTCLKTTTLGGIPSYVELLTCVEMREAAANGQSGAPSGSMTSGRSVGSGAPVIGSPVPGAVTGGTAGTTGLPTGPAGTPGNPGSNLNGGLGVGSAGATGAGTTGVSSGRSAGSGAATVSSPSPAGSGAAGSAGAGAAGGGSAGGGGGGGGGH